MIINQILSKNLPFIAYRMPGEKQSVVLMQKNREVALFDFDELENQKGFVIAPYESYADGKAFLLQPSFISRNESGQKQVLDFLNQIPDNVIQFSDKEIHISEEDFYLDQVERMINQMKSGRLNKVVLSRIMIKKLLPEFDIDLFFEQLCRQYPKAFIYIFHLPGKGVWAGATPETLLQKHGDYFETMALAGTQKRPQEETTIQWEWGEKEVQEQQYVSDFIENQLTKLNVSSYEKGKAETVFAGTLAHICTRFKIPFSELAGKTGKLVRALHPTPAVCGIPKEKAWKLIADIEKHKRRFYTGFLGPWNLDGLSHLFVNLRCARLLEYDMEIYVGGGLTADSIPEKEWQETQDKSQTILSAIENLRKFAP